jgi:hypothetical protein
LYVVLGGGKGRQADAVYRPDEAVVPVSRRLRLLLLLLLLAVTMAGAPRPVVRVLVAPFDPARVAKRPPARLPPSPNP